jgi:hypothetical protein
MCSKKVMSLEQKRHLDSSSKFITLSLTAACFFGCQSRVEWIFEKRRLERQGCKQKESLLFVDRYSSSLFSE